MEIYIFLKLKLFLYVSFNGILHSFWVFREFGRVQGHSGTGLGSVIFLNESTDLDSHQN